MDRKQFLSQLDALEQDILNASADNKALSVKSSQMINFVAPEDLQKAIDALTYAMNSIIRAQINIEELKGLVSKEEELV